jgi:aminoglycoside 3-N-acetyltransferase
MPGDMRTLRGGNGGPPAAGHDTSGLARQLAALGVADGGVLLVHASLRSTAGVRAQTLITAVRLALGPGGTLVVPAFTPENSDTSRAHLERVRGMDAALRARFEAAMPAFDPAVTPAPSMGVLAEAVRTTQGAARSAHPQTSFAALGPQARRITAGHRPDCHLGEESPLAALYRAGAGVLLLGVGYESCSAFHLAEYRVPDPPLRSYRCVVRRAGRPRWWGYEDVALDDRDFPALGTAYESGEDGPADGPAPAHRGGGPAPPPREGRPDGVTDGGPGPVRYGTVGGARCRLIDLRDAVDFAVRWLPGHRPRAAGAAGAPRADPGQPSAGDNDAGSSPRS